MSREFAEFFDPLVGSPEAIERFQGFLARRISKGARPNDAEARFGNLSRALDTAVEVYYRRLLQSDHNPDRAEKVSHNIRVGAVQLTVSALKAVCQHYVDVRDSVIGLAPQRRSSVERSVDNTREFLLDVASRSKEQAVVGIYAAQHGADVGDISTNPGLRGPLIEGGKGPSASLYPAFEVRYGADSQVEVALRHPLPAYAGGRHCPAMGEVTPGGDESLDAYLRVVGRVVIDEIYSHQMPIRG